MTIFLGGERLQYTEITLGPVKAQKPETVIKWVGAPFPLDQLQENSLHGET